METAEDEDVLATAVARRDLAVAANYMQYFPSLTLRFVCVRCSAKEMEWFFENTQASVNRIQVYPDGAQTTLLHEMIFLESRVRAGSSAFHPLDWRRKLHYLFAHGVDVNRPSQVGEWGTWETPIYTALSLGCETSVTLLLYAGASLETICASTLADLDRNWLVGKRKCLRSVCALLVAGQQRAVHRDVIVMFARSLWRPRYALSWYDEHERLGMWRKK